MRRRSTALTVLLLLCAASAAQAERHFFHYRNPDAGTLVVSFSTTDGDSGGALIERSDWTGSAQIQSTPNGSQHDFAETFNSHAFIAASGVAGFDNTETQYYGKVEIIKLPPGKYHFWRPDKDFPVLGRYEPVHPEFEIQTGRTTYVGAFRYVRLYGSKPETWYATRYYIVQHVNAADRDLAIAKSVGINVDDPIIIGPDRPAPIPAK